MFESWINQHPWMTFVLGMMCLLTMNTFFIAIGGGYKKYPTLEQQKEDKDKKVIND